MTSSFLDRNIVIASVQTDGEHYSSNYQHSTQVPTSRPNGGDLRPGDIWVDTNTDVYYSYNGVEWQTIGGPGILNPLLQQIADLELRVAELEDK